MGKLWISVYFRKSWHLVSLAVEAEGRVAVCLQHHQLSALAKQGRWLNRSYSLPAVLLESKAPLPSLPADVLLGGQAAVAESPPVRPPQGWHLLCSCSPRAEAESLLCRLQRIILSPCLQLH